MSTGDWSEGDEPEIGARGLTLCQRVEFHLGREDGPYTLHHVLTAFRPNGVFPLVLDLPLWLYTEYHGTPGEYEVWVDLVRLVYDPQTGEVLDEVEDTMYGPYKVNLPPDVFVHAKAYCLRKVPFTEPGLHEFRLRAAGAEEPLASLRVLVRG